MNYIPLNFGILRVPQNWIVIGLVMAFTIQAVNLATPKL